MRKASYSTRKHDDVPYHVRARFGFVPEYDQLEPGDLILTSSLEADLVGAAIRRVQQKSYVSPPLMLGGSTPPSTWVVA